MEVLLAFRRSQWLPKDTVLCNWSRVPGGHMKCNGPFITDLNPKGVTINNSPSFEKGSHNYSGLMTCFHHQGYSQARNAVDREF